MDPLDSRFRQNLDELPRPGSGWLLLLAGLAILALPVIAGLLAVHRAADLPPLLPAGTAQAPAAHPRPRRRALRPPASRRRPRRHNPPGPAAA